MMLLTVVSLLGFFALLGSFAYILNYEFKEGLYTEVTEWIADTVNGIAESLHNLIFGKGSGKE